MQLITCERVKKKHGPVAQVCKTSQSSSPIKFSFTGVKLAATLSRGGVTFASGFAVGGGGTRLIVSPHRTITKGSYTLTLKNGGKQLRETVTVG